MVRKTILERVKNLKTSKKLDYISLIKDPEYLQIYRYHMNQDEKLRSNRILDLICNSYDYSIEEIYEILVEENEMSTKKNTKKNKVNKKREEKKLNSFAELAEEFNSDELEKIPVAKSKIEGKEIIDDIIANVEDADIEIIEPSEAKKVINNKKTKDHNGPIEIIINKDVETISNAMAKEDEKETVIIKNIVSEKTEKTESEKEDSAKDFVNVIKNVITEKRKEEQTSVLTSKTGNTEKRKEEQTSVLTSMYGLYEKLIPLVSIKENKKEIVYNNRINNPAKNNMNVVRKNINDAFSENDLERVKNTLDIAIKKYQNINSTMVDSWKKLRHELDNDIDKIDINVIKKVSRIIESFANRNDKLSMV